MTQEKIIEMAQTLSHGWWLDDEKLEAFAKLVEGQKCEELAKKIEAMPFGDTGASFAAWIREQA